MADRPRIEHTLFLLAVGILAWIIPGGGHFLIRERRRAIIIFVTITLTFAVGLYVGSIAVVNSVDAKPWFFAQICASPVVGFIDNISRSGYTDTTGQHVKYTAFGRPGDVGQIYTSIAGLLNLLSILSAVYMAYTGRGEMIGTEEETHA
ncbi:MAG: hypothetical protein GX455_08655 [Phycisphaerae bacterium]|nr:hypothetical protein [Phycisphaerae bacterium]